MLDLEILNNINTKDEEIKKLANKALNDKDAQYLLGMVYKTANYKKYDVKKALFHLEKAASKNSIEAKYELTELYNSKEFKNMILLKEYLDELVNLDYKDSKYRLGRYYLRKGKFELGYNILNECVDNKNITAINYLGKLYFEKQEYIKAITYFELGANLKDSTSIEYAFFMYKHSIGIEFDLQKALSYQELLDKSITEEKMEVYEVNTLIKLNQFEKALDLVKDFQYTGKKIIAPYYKGVILHKMGKKVEAKESLLQYLDICKNMIAKDSKLSSSKEKMLKQAIKYLGDNKLYNELGHKFSKTTTSKIDDATYLFNNNKYDKALKLIDLELSKKLSNFESNSLLQLKARTLNALNDPLKAIETYKLKTDLFNKVNFGYISLLLANNKLNDVYEYINKCSNINTSTHLRICLTFNNFKYYKESEQLLNKLDLKNITLKESDKKLIKNLTANYK